MGNPGSCGTAAPGCVGAAEATSVERARAPFDRFGELRPGKLRAGSVPHRLVGPAMTSIPLTPLAV